MRDKSYSEIFLEVVELNNLTTKDVVEITGKPYNTVAKYFNRGLDPDEITMVLVCQALSYAKQTVTRDLIRVRDSVNNRAYRWGKTNKSNRKKAKLVGEKRRNTKFAGEKKYIYGGKTMNMTGVAEASGRAIGTISRRFKVDRVKEGTDVTSIIETIKPYKKRGK